MISKEKKREVLEKARALIEKGWTQGASARTADGIVVHQSSQEAQNFCLLGAISRACEGDVDGPSSYASVLEFLQGTKVCVSFNDEPGRTKEEVLNVLDQVLKGLSHDS